MLVLVLVSPLSPTPWLGADSHSTQGTEPSALCPGWPSWPGSGSEVVLHSANIKTSLW